MSLNERCRDRAGEVGGEDIFRRRNPIHFYSSFDARSPHSENSENPAMITVLPEAGADRQPRDKYGRVPWDYAKDREELTGSEAYGRLREGLL